jgi:hypothetical protein
VALNVVLCNLLSCGQNVTPQIYAGTSHIVVIFPTYVRTGKMN